MKFVNRVMMSVGLPAAALVVLTIAVAAGSAKLESAIGGYFAHEDRLFSDAGEMYAQGLQMGQARRKCLSE
jgi:hypothetical protein